MLYRETYIPGHPVCRKGEKPLAFQWQKSALCYPGESIFSRKISHMGLHTTFNALMDINRIAGGLTYHGD
jgi:hypothetical protein